MAPEPQSSGGQQVNRVFEQPPDTVSFYSDIAQVFATPHEIVLQFYETIPGPPSGPTAQVQMVRTRLRSTVVLSKAHALNIGQLLLQRASAEEEELRPTPRPGSAKP